ncbi:MAG: hypothetical protein RMJ56_07400 [Gemmataceae bacterium]|nr:hypothetical protein [Gemmata sp.]MDW8197417.1 hypothetical protein [Gemmataceae bacterium]
MKTVAVITACLMASAGVGYYYITTHGICPFADCPIAPAGGCCVKAPAESLACCATPCPDCATSCPDCCELCELCCSGAIQAPVKAQVRTKSACCAANEVCCEQSAECCVDHASTVATSAINAATAGISLK